MKHLEQDPHRVNSFSPHFLRKNHCLELGAEMLRGLAERELRATRETAEVKSWLSHVSGGWQ